MLEIPAPIPHYMPLQKANRYHTAEGPRTELATYFLNLGVDVDALNEGNGTALVAASANGFEELVKLFPDKGANIHHRSSTDGTAIEAAKAVGHQTIVQMLAEAYVRPHLQEAVEAGLPLVLHTPIGWMLTILDQNSSDGDAKMEETQGPSMEGQTFDLNWRSSNDLAGFLATQQP